MIPDKCPNCGSKALKESPETPTLFVCGSRHDSARGKLAYRTHDCVLKAALAENRRLGARVKRMKAENEKLREWVKEAYEEGHYDRNDRVPLSDGWRKSIAHARLERGGK